MDERFKTLRLLGTIYKVVAWLGVAGGVVAFYMLWGTSAYKPSIPEPGSYYPPPSGMSLSQGLEIVIGTGLHFILFLGLSQAIQLMLDVGQRSLQAARSAGDAVSSLGSVDVRLQKISGMLEKALPSLE